MGVGSRAIKVTFLGDESDLKRAASGAGHATGKLGSALGKVAKVGAIALAGAAVVAGKALVGMTKNAMEDEAAQRKLAIGLKNATGATDEKIAAVERWISAQGRALGITDDEMRPALQRLAESTGDVSEAQDQMRIAMDVAAGTGKSLKTVTEAMMKANNGSIAGLSRLGLKTKNAAGETISYEAALRKMADTFGGQAAAKAQTLEGKMDRLKLIFDETKESIGAKLIPVVDKMATWFMGKGLPAIKETAAELQDRFGPTIQKVGAWIQGKLIPAGMDLARSLTSTVVPILAKLAGWVRDKLLPALGRLAQDLLPLVKRAFEGVKAALKDAQPFFDLVGKVITNVLIPGLGKLAKVVIPVLIGALRGVGKILGAVGDAGRWLWNNALQPVFKFIVSAVGKVLTWFGRMLQLIGKAPGMDWVGRLGDKLVTAGGKANGLANSIRDIPDSHNTRISADTRQATANVRGLYSWLMAIPRFIQTQTIVKGTHFTRRARGGPAGGLTLVGEEGPEFVRLPAGSFVHTAQQTRAMLGSGGRRTLAGTGGGGLTVNFNSIVGDPRAVGREIVRVLREYEGGTGQRVLA